LRSHGFTRRATVSIVGIADFTSPLLLLCFAALALRREAAGVAMQTRNNHEEPD
jgi:hypothetical protein